VYKVFQTKAKWVAAAAVASLLAPMAAMAAPSAQEIVDKYTMAIGGAEKLASAKTVVKKGQFLLIDMGMSAVLESTNSGDNFKNTIAVEGMGEITQGITDGTVWQLHFMEGDSILEGDAAAAIVRQADINAWGNWKEYFASIETAGEVDGDYKVVFKPKGEGEDTVAFFDMETGLLDKMETTGPDGSPAVMTLSDYKEVGGIKFSYKTEIESGMNIEMIFDSIELGSDVDAATFELPEVIKALMPADEGVTAASLMEQMDANKDGKVSMDEAPEQMQASFGMIDMNADDAVDLEEMQMVADFINNQ
jgi:hypothetical protein